MRFSTWEPVYEAILDDFGYDRTADERARDVLASFVTPFDQSTLSFDGQTIAIAGAGPSLAAEIDIVDSADAVFAASTAVDVLRSAGVGTDLMTTDLDKNPETANELSYEGVPVAVHAHGDNIEAIRQYVPSYDRKYVLGTTQAAPTESVYNFGGFTDGDRAAFLADHFEADELIFLGWDFDDPSVSPTKRKKLRWAERLLYWLEQRRNESFDILDGRRSTLDVSVLPVD